MDSVDITKVLIPEMTFLDMETFQDKEDLFSYISRKLKENGIVSDAEKFEQALYARENEGSTYIGQMLALPHGICDEVLSPGVSFCRVKTPFLYKSHGEEGLVKFIFTMAIVQQGGKSQHLKILAELARLLAHDDFLEILGKVDSYEELVDSIKIMKEREELCI